MEPLLVASDEWEEKNSYVKPPARKVRMFAFMKKQRRIMKKEKKRLI